MPETSQIAELTAHIVAGYVEKNSLAPTALPDLISSIAASIANLGAAANPAAPKLTPAVPIKKSVQDDYIVCLEDGKKFKSLKRHLGVHYNLTPDEYRQKWGLAPDYPMVAPAYAAVRSELAKKSGLGRKSKPALKRKTKAK